MNPISTASAGLITASSRFDQASAKLASAAGGNGDMASAVVDQVSAKIQFEASAKALKAVNDTMKNTLDILV
ncbi:MAG: hypothetical protein P4L64_00800 [Caulobacteraceae bacterium]|nr:hypothetical protein [Caulobacteraceae bacterium]